MKHSRWAGKFLLSCFLSRVYPEKGAFSSVQCREWGERGSDLTLLPPWLLGKVREAQCHRGSLVVVGLRDVTKDA